MGFLDKAKQLADQAQTKLDEVQKDFNAKQQGSAQPAPPPAAPADKSPTIDPGAPGPSPEPAQDRPHGDPLVDSAPKPPTPPSPGSGMSSGDPLGG